MDASLMSKEAAEEAAENPSVVKTMKQLFYQAINSWNPAAVQLTIICKNFASENQWYSDWIELQGGWPE